MERYGLTRSMSAKDCSPDNAAAEGFFGRMKTESVYPEHWEKRTRDEVLVLIDEYIHWYNHERIKQSQPRRADCANATSTSFANRSRDCSIFKPSDSLTAIFLN